MFVPLEKEVRTHVDTGTASLHMNRRAQTLYVWACKGNGPIRPVRVYGRLQWPVDEIRRVLKGEVLHADTTPRKAEAQAVTC